MHGGRSFNLLCYLSSNLGVHWGAAIPGFLALAMLPAPLLFYKYGAAIRARCKYTKLAEEAMESMMNASQPEVKKVEK